jgi:hypothetical protein
MAGVLHEAAQAAATQALALNWRALVPHSLWLRLVDVFIVLEVAFKLVRRRRRRPRGKHRNAQSADIRH